MAKASKSCIQLIIFLCTFPWLLWSFSSIHENYKHVIIICEWNSHKTIEKIFLIIACFAQSPRSKFCIYRVKVTATERPQLEWRVRGGPGAQLQKRLLVYLPPRPPRFIFLSAWRNEHLSSFFYHLWFIQSPPLGTLIPFLSHQVPHTSHEQTSPGLSLVFISAGGAKRSQGIPGV